VNNVNKEKKEGYLKILILLAVLISILLINFTFMGNNISSPGDYTLTPDTSTPINDESSSSQQGETDYNNPDKPTNSKSGSGGNAGSGGNTGSIGPSGFLIEGSDIKRINTITGNVVSYDCDYTISSGITIDGKSSAYSGLGPGKVVCVNAGTYTSQIRIINVHGAEGNPVIFVNKGGQVKLISSTTNDMSHRGILIMGSSHIRITGTGSDNYYGFYFDGWYNAIEAGRAVGSTTSYKSTDIEIDHIESNNAGYSGIMAKTDPVVGSSLSCTGIYRSNFAMKNILIHDNYIHNTGGEGMYLGFTHFEKSYSCPTGQEQAHLMDGVLIYNNLVTDTGIDGIQVGGITGDCRIFNNTILRDDTKNDGYYGKSGIQINPGYNCDAYNNFIKDGNGEGIRLFAEEGNVYNNIIVNQKGGGGIWFKNTESLNSASDKINVMNNVIINSGSIVGIGADNKYATGKIQNNIIVSSNTNYIGKQYIGDYSSRYTVSNNIKTSDINYVKFVNPGNNDYSLLSNSPCVNAGIDATSLFNFDYYNNARHSGNACDIGAIEYGASSNTIPDSIITTTDTIPPVVSISNSPLNPGTSDLVTLNAVSTETSEIKIYVDNTVVKSCLNVITCSNAGTYSAGSHSYYATAKDSSNNLGKSETKTFSVSSNSVTTSGKVYTYAEAESFNLRDPMKSYKDNTASNKKYISAANLNDYYARAIYTFNIANSGQYVIWGRVKAGTENNNAFHISMDKEYTDAGTDDGVSTIWSLPVTNTWTWDKISMETGSSPKDLVYDFSSGNHKLFIKYKEPNAKLDRVLVTNDLGFIPK